MKTNVLKLKGQKANILIFAGENDRMWASAESARLIEKYSAKSYASDYLQRSWSSFAGDGIVDSRGIYPSVGGNKAASMRLL